MNENHDACSGQDASLVAVESADSSRSEGTSGFLWSDRSSVRVRAKEGRGDVLCSRWVASTGDDVLERLLGCNH